MKTTLRRRGEEEERSRRIKSENHSQRFGKKKTKQKNIEPGNRPAEVVWADNIVKLARKSSHRGLLDRQNRMLSQKVVPQGAFGQTKS